MKKLFSIVAVICLTTFCAQAQREVKSVQLISYTDAAGGDTIKINPNAYETIIKHTLTDSVTYKLVSTSRAIVGDKITFTVINTAGGTKFRTVASGTYPFEVSGADSLMTVTASKWATQVFIFNGTSFVEQFTNPR